MGVMDCVGGGAKISATESREVFTINMSSNSSLDLPRRDVESHAPLTKSTSSSSRWNICWKICIDLPLIVIVFAFIGLYELKVIPSHKAGFFCNDPKLSHQFTGDTVSAEFLIPTVLLGPPVIVLITEFLQTKHEFKQRMKLSIRRTLHIFRCYLYGLCFNTVVLEVLKGVTGMPRPTFFDLCEPDTGKTCTGLHHLDKYFNSYDDDKPIARYFGAVQRHGAAPFRSEFVSTFQCTSTKYDRYMQYDSYHSFPSGHTSLSVHAGFFVVWYLQSRAFSWHSRSIFLIPFLQLSAIAYSAVCSLTRITDHRHHWWDVLFGAGIGFATVIYSGFVLLNNLSPRKYEDSTRESRDDLQRCSPNDPRFVTV